MSKMFNNSAINLNSNTMNSRVYNQTFDKLNKISDKLNVVNVNNRNKKRLILIKIIIQNSNFYIKKFLR